MKIDDGVIKAPKGKLLRGYLVDDGPFGGNSVLRVLIDEYGLVLVRGYGWSGLQTMPRSRTSSFSPTSPPTANPCCVGRSPYQPGSAAPGPCICRGNVLMNSFLATVTNTGSFSLSKLQGETK